MCAIFGLIDYRNYFTKHQREKVLKVLSKECEVRGTDATGFAYIHDNKLSIFKRPLAAHKMRLRLPFESNIVMGHTRMATQGNKFENYNNHPLPRTLLKKIFDLIKDDEFENAVIRNQLISNDYRELKKAMRKDESFATTKYEIYSKIMIGLSYRYLDIGRYVKSKSNWRDANDDDIAKDSRETNATHTPEETKTQDNNIIEIWQINKSEDQQVARNIRALLRTFDGICGKKLPADDAVKK